MTGARLSGTLRVAQTAALILIAAVLGVLAVAAEFAILQFYALGFGHTFLGTMSLTLTSRGFDRLSIVLAVLLAVVAVTAAIRLRGWWVAAVGGLLIADLPVAVFSPSISMALAGGAAAMLGAIMLQGARGTSGNGFSVAVITVTIAFGLSAALLSLNTMKVLYNSVPDFTRTTEYVQVRSPDGQWLAIGMEYDEGAMGGSAEVVVRKDVLGGMVRLRRLAYNGDWDRPRVRWIDNRTLRVDGQELDILADPTLNGYSD